MRILKGLFLGGAYAQIPIIREAKQRGIYIITCDYLPNNPGHQLADEYYNISTTDVEKVLQLAKDKQVDFVFAYASDPAAPVASYVSEKLGLPGNSFKSVQTLSEKDLFRQFLEQNGFNAPKSISISENDDIEKMVSQLTFPIVVKPTDSCGSKGVSKLTSMKMAKEAIAYAMSFSRNKRLIAEEFIESNGEQFHGDGFVVDGKLVFSYIGDHHYNVSVNQFVPYSTTWPSEKSAHDVERVEKEVAKIIELVGFSNGPINIEARIDIHNKVYIMEIGARSGGNFVPQVINYTSGFDMVKASVDLFLGTPVIVPSLPKKCGAYFVVHTDKNGTLQSLTISEKLKTFIKEFHQYVQAGGKVNSFQGANAAIGVLLLTFDSQQQMHDVINNMNQYIDISIE
jgi:biotin carboxylase